MITQEHVTSELDYSAPSPTNPDVYRRRSRELRQHVTEKHDAGNGWAAGAGIDIIAEWHNLEHGRDAHGRPFEPAELAAARGEAYKPKTIAINADGIGRVVAKAHGFQLDLAMARRTPGETRCLVCGAYRSEHA